MEEILISDEIFRKCILDILNKPADYQITKEDCESITFINCCDLGVEILKGIEFFINLRILNCSNNHLTSLDLSKNINLIYLYYYNNQLTNIKLNKKINHTKYYKSIITNFNNLTIQI